MRKLVRLLESIPQEENAVVTFEDEEILSLRGFGRVDESIYDRDDLVVAQVVERIKSDSDPRFQKPGSLIQFSVTEIASVNVGEKCIFDIGASGIT